ncbi:MAG: 23S rRNA (adenine(2503)-C(2))-methyltransferase RlmN [Spirochaetaceae bacterium]|nr:MAG: 23S rRNA (adenine(2503)-C(2))-methyltransferase RlmN [Spirochaetaceae bacterium]
MSTTAETTSEPDRPDPRSLPSTLLGMDREELCRMAENLGFPAYRGTQIHHWLYRRTVREIGQMTNLPAALRETLRDRAGGTDTVGAHPPVSVNESSDGTRKYLFPTAHGGFVESALIPEGKRITLCLSTQVGCRRSCTFCQTARQGFQGNLQAGEILNQYHSIPERERITNIVYMGMGEPLDNWENGLRSLRIFTDPEGYALAARRITLSTVGIHPQLEHFLRADTKGPVSLAISLHTPFPEERRRLMPVENANPIEETVRLIRELRADRERRISFEYTMFSGFNDTQRHVDGIARLLNGLRFRINLIPFHQIEGVDLRPTSPEEIEAFAERLRRKDIPTFIRRSRGQDINAACGLLWTRHVQQG